MTVTPRSQRRRSTFASACPRVSWACSPSRSTGTTRQDGVEDALDVGRRRGADRVAEADVVAAEVEQAGRGVGGRLRRDRARVRAAERDRHVAAGPHAALAGGGEDGRGIGQGGLAGPAEVRLVERVGGADDDGDLVGAGGDRPLEAARRRDEDRVPDARRAR